MAVSGDLTSRFTCISDGVNFLNGIDYVDVGRCSGQLVSDVCDSTM